MAFSLKGRVAVVTGSSRGLGKGMIMSLGEAGAKVGINYCNSEEIAEKTFAEFRDRGYEGTLVKASAVDPDDVDRMVKHVERELGGVDIVVPNATPDQPQRPIEEYDWAFYEQMLDYFVKSPFLLTRACLPHMKQQGWGRIINISSEVFHASVGNFSAYVAAKGGQNGFTRSMATELAPWGITVNLIAPGWIPTERHANDPQAAKDAYKQTIPMGRWGVPKDVADAVVYFASEESSFVSGQTLCVNGARTPW